LIVLDIMLPGMDGLEVCRSLRAGNSPVAILMLTARDEDVDKIVGLEMGADDYLTKPFNPRELVARVKAILRRSDRKTQPAHPPLHLADLTIDPARHEVTLSGRPVDLRHQEFNLLLTLAEHKGLVLSREKLLDLAWGYEYAGETRTVDVHIGHLRKKLAGSHIRIETVTSDGYKLVV
jgi:two-component system alkaline phosphatase synthesis response regulator PhoP